MALNATKNSRRAPGSSFADDANYDNQSQPFWRRRLVVLGVSVGAAMFACAAVLLLWKFYFAPQANVEGSTLQSAPILQSIKNVSYTGEMQHLRTQDLQLFSNSIRGNIWSVDLNEIRAAAQAYSWVRNAEVRRSFPDGLAIRLEEHKPFARWGAGEFSFVNTFGEVFELSPSALKPKLDSMASSTPPSAAVATSALKMPVFIGPTGRAAEIVKHYQWLQKRFEPLGRQVAEVRLTVRGALRVRDNRGTVIELGRLQIEERLDRVLSAWPHVAAMQQANMHIDARYPSGLALSVNLGANLNGNATPATTPQTEAETPDIPALETEKLVHDNHTTKIDNLLASYIQQTKATGIIR